MTEVRELEAAPGGRGAGGVAALVAAPPHRATRRRAGTYLDMRFSLSERQTTWPAQGALGRACSTEGKVLRPGVWGQPPHPWAPGDAVVEHLSPTTAPDRSTAPGAIGCCAGSYGSAQVGSRTWHTPCSNRAQGPVQARGARTPTSTALPAYRGYRPIDDRGNLHIRLGHAPHGHSA